MTHSTLQICWPWLLLIAALLLVLRLLAAVSGAKLHLGRLRALNSDEAGSVQSLSFILTLPVFMMILMGIVQVSQLMIAKVFVEYAAFAAARSAIVWVPATLVDSDEGPNEIRDLSLDDSGEAGGGDGTYYKVDPGSNKAFRIQMAAAQAMMSVAPSRDTAAGSEQSQQGFIAYSSILKAYQGMVPDSKGNSSVPRRLANKLAYCLRNTQVEIRVFHPSSEPDLGTWMVPSDLGEYYANEVGWQDSITVKVTHNVALLPGPGRMFAQYMHSHSESQVQAPLVEDGDLVTWPLTATATLGVEGEKPLIRYDHLSNGMPL